MGQFLHKKLGPILLRARLKARFGLSTFDKLKRSRFWSSDTYTTSYGSCLPFFLPSAVLNYILDRLVEFKRMSFMKGDLLTKTRKLVKGFVKTEPLWLKSMEKAPPATFPRAQNKLRQITLPEDTYVNKFYQKHPDSKFKDPIKISGFDPPAARSYAWRVLELKEQGIDEGDAVTIADCEYRAQRKEQKNAYARLKKIAKLQGKRPPPNPFPSAIKEIQAEERKFVNDRFYNPKTRETLERLQRERDAMMLDRR